ncbi:hypothetical protein BDV93DRAFT_520006 [Ceratobasidium sp. AG-I]|nr:hypothetical protein BDV93DRAFT_520006 [Ceratobasidium sp. AG-I]
MPPAPLRRAEPLVSASGLPSPALGPRTPTSEDTPYTLLRTLPRRHRSVREKVGSHLKKLLARAKSFTVPEGRHNAHPHSAQTERPRPHEYEDLVVRSPRAAQDVGVVAGGSLGARGRPHSRTMSDSSQFISSVRRRLTLTLAPGTNTTSATSVPSPATSSGELVDRHSAPSTPPPQLAIPKEKDFAVDGGKQSNKPTPSPSPLRRPLSLAPTRSHASSTPRVVEEDESAMRAYDHDSSTQSHSHNHTDADHAQYLLPDSPTAFKAGEFPSPFRDGGPYLPVGEDRMGVSGASLFGDDAGTSSVGSHRVDLPDEPVLAPIPVSANTAHSTIAQTVPKQSQPPHTQPHTTGKLSSVPPAPTPESNPNPNNTSGGAGSGPTYVNPSMDANSMELDETVLEPKIPVQLVQGTPMLKVTSKKIRQKFFRLDADQGLVTWESEKAGIINIENIKELRVGEAARYYREQFKISQEREERWLSIIYTSDNKYKILHVVAFSKETAHLWHRTLSSLHVLRRSVMCGLVSPARIWERHYWRGADMSRDEKLELEEMERLCRRLNVSLGKEEILKRFKSSDKGGKGYLDFTDFQQFVKTLQARPEIKRLWKKLKGDGLFDVEVFVRFMREEQKTDLSQDAIERIFNKYSTGGAESTTASLSLDSTRATSPSRPRSNTSPAPSRPASPPFRRSMSSTPQSQQRSRSHSRSRSRSRSGAATAAAHALAKLVPGSLGGKFGSTGSFSHAEPAVAPAASHSEQYSIAAGLAPSTALAVPLPPHWTLDDFTTFLLSTENAAFGDKAHDMTRPLSEYYISSSHNTYLVGHQLVGESTIEGYIRALGSGCRSVEVDIWDGDSEPVITHGRTLTGSVSLKHVAQAIAKYAFVASPYPVIISAEMHAGIEQQSMVAATFKEVFGDMLVTAPIAGSGWGGPGDVEELELLPSPEALKGRVLVKFKNALLSEVEIEVDNEDVLEEETQSSDSESLKELGRAKSMVKRVRRSFIGKRPDMSDLSPPITPPSTLMLDPMSAALVMPSSYNAGHGNVVIPLSPPTSPPRKKQRAYSNRSDREHEKPKLKMSRSLADLLVYTVGVKFRGLNKKERYAVEQMFSLSEKTANKVLKENCLGMVKHCRTNLVRLYPNGTRVTSTNYEPNRYWAAGVQLVAINWQTIDMGNMMNQAMFQRNSRAGYLLKPEALRIKDKEPLTRRTEYILDITVISAQQVPRPRDEAGREIIKDAIMDPLVEVSLYTPDWPTAPLQDFRSPGGSKADGKPDKKAEGKGDKKGEGKGSERRRYRTTAIKNNGFNPVWEESVSIPFSCVGDMWDLIFVKFAVVDDDDDDDPLAVYCASLGNLRQGYRHLPLHDLQFSQYLFSTLFVHISLRRAQT